MARYAAPEHTSEIHLTSGPVPVVDGYVDIPDDAPQSDIFGLATNGFTLAPSAAATKAPVSTSVETGTKDA